MSRAPRLVARLGLKLRAARGPLLSLLALLALIASPGAAMASRAPMPDCGMASATASRVASPVKPHEPVCPVACSACNQYLPAATDKGTLVPVAAASIVYVGTDRRLVGMHPERSTPPPR